MIEYATTFIGGELITPYLATAYAEGFCEGEDAIGEDRLRAWSYLCGTKLGYSLQGWFGRVIEELINQEYLDINGKILKKLPEED